MPAVNEQRRPRRGEKTQATRLRVLEAARELFLARGYLGTRIEEIARGAGVAVQTIYFLFGNKRTVLKELVDVSCSGEDDPAPPLDRGWVQQVAETADPAEQLSLYVRHVRSIHERVGPVLEVLREAATTDPDIADLWEQNKKHRLDIQGHIVGLLAAKGALRADLSQRRATEIVYGVMSQELFAILVMELSWSVTQWADWAHEILSMQLLDEGVRASKGG